MAVKLSIIHAHVFTLEFNPKTRQVKTGMTISGTMPEAVVALREFVAAGKKQDIVLEGDELVFGERRFPRKLETPFRSTSKNAELYQLDALWFSLTTNLVSGHYVMACGKQKIQQVRYGDRNALSKYFTCAMDTCALIDNDVLERQLIADRAARDEMHAERKKAKAEAGVSLEDVLARERPITTTLSCIQSDGKLFTDVLQSFKRVMAQKQADIQKESSAAVLQGKDKKRSLSGSRSSSKDSKRARTLSSSSVAGRPAPVPRSDTDRIPIIVVPNARQSLVSLMNARQLLAEYKFVPPEALMAKGAKKPEQPIEFEIYSHASSSVKGGKKKKVKFHIYDDVKGFTEMQWARIVGLFVLGKNWQLQPFLEGGRFKNPADIFDHIASFHLDYDDVVPSKNILEWRLHRFPVIKSMRHNDKSMVLDVWNRLYEHMSARKKMLRF